MTAESLTEPFELIEPSLTLTAPSEERKKTPASASFHSEETAVMLIVVSLADETFIEF